MATIDERCEGGSTKHSIRRRDIRCPIGGSGAAHDGNKDPIFTYVAIASPTDGLTAIRRDRANAPGEQPILRRKAVLNALADS